MSSNTEYIALITLLSLCTAITVNLCARGKNAYRDYSAARREFTLWKEANPSVYIGLSDQGKSLVFKLIFLHDTYYELVPFVSDDVYRKHLLSLFDELPPRPYKPNPPKGMKPLLLGVVFSCKE